MKTKKFPNVQISFKTKKQCVEFAEELSKGNVADIVWLDMRIK